MSNGSTICLTPDCSGRGLCMVPDEAINNISMCICDLPWSGKTDILNFDGYDCVDFGLLRQILYGCVAMRVMYNMTNLYLQFKCQWRIFQSIKGKRRKKGPIIKHWWQMLSLKVLVAYLINHCLTAYFCLAMAVGDGVIGVNPYASMAYILQSIFAMYATISINITTLKALLAGVGMDKKGKNIVQYVRIANFVAVTMYLVCLFAVFTFLPIHAASTTIPPNESIIVPALLVFRNLSVICLYIYSVWLGTFTSSKVRAVINQRSSAVGSKKASSAADVKMEMLLKKLDFTSQNMKKTGIVITILYITFSLPWLHPFQGYLYTYAFFQGVGAGHPSRVYMDEGKSSGPSSSRVGPGKSEFEDGSAATSVGAFGGQTFVATNVEQ